MKDLMIGTYIADMHAQGFRAVDRDVYNVRNEITFNLSGIAQGVGFTNVIMCASKGYVNKHLIVVGYSEDDVWYPAMAVYDGHRVYICEVSLRG